MNKQSITERIKSAKKYLGVSRRELIEQMINFYKLRDINGMRQMFGAYEDWEINRRGSKTIEGTIQLAKENFDFIAIIADCYVNTGDIILGIWQSVNLPKNGSMPISQFYREITGYQPFEPNVN